MLPLFSLSLTPALPPDAHTHRDHKYILAFGVAFILSAKVKRFFLTNVTYFFSCEMVVFWPWNKIFNQFSQIIQTFFQVYQTIVVFSFMNLSLLNHQSYLSLIWTFFQSAHNECN